jgi:hypothetical protein
VLPKLLGFEKGPWRIFEIWGPDASSSLLSTAARRALILERGVNGSGDSRPDAGVEAREDPIVYEELEDGNQTRIKYKTKKKLKSNRDAQQKKGYVALVDKIPSQLWERVGCGVEMQEDV